MLKISSSDSWLDSLIESLTDPEEAAGYLSVALEEKASTRQLLRNAIKDVVEAYSKINNLSEEAKLHYEQLENLLAKNGGSEIHSLINLLSALGFRLTVDLKKEDNLAN
jgi:DNA-binding phage protein